MMWDPNCRLILYKLAKKGTQVHTGMLTRTSRTDCPAGILLIPMKFLTEISLETAHSVLSHGTFWSGSYN